MSKSGNKRPSFTEKKAWGRAQKEIGAVLDPETMQPIVRYTTIYCKIIATGKRLPCKRLPLMTRVALAMIDDK